MSKRCKITIACLLLCIVLLTAVYVPQIYKRGWANNEMDYDDTSGYGLQRVCDEALWQKPKNCRYTDEAQKTLEILRSLDKDFESRLAGRTSP